MDESQSTLTEARQGLQALAARSAIRSKAGRLRQLLPDVENALISGATHAEVLQELAKVGLVMSPQTFSSTLRRLRRQRPGARASATTMAPASPAETTSGRETSLAAGIAARESQRPRPPEASGPDTPTPIVQAAPARRRPLTLEEALANRPNVSELESKYNSAVRKGEVTLVNDWPVEATGETPGQTPTAAKPTSRP